MGLESRSWVSIAKNASFVIGVLFLLYRLLVAGKDPVWAITLPLGLGGWLRRWRVALVRNRAEVRTDLSRVTRFHG